MRTRDRVITFIAFDRNVSVEEARRIFEVMPPHKVKPLFVLVASNNRRCKCQKKRRHTD